ncbi:MAG: hypothetical protein ACJ79S_13200 [Gemmatimonadaceae bacterium]
MRTWLVALACAALLPAGAGAQYSVALGAGPTAGVVGLEVLWPAAGRRAAVAVGGGVAGLGGRGLVYLGAGTPVGRAAARRYASAGYLATPWRFGTIRASGAVALEGGAQLWPAAGRGLLADLAAGVVIPHGGTWGGNTVAPSVRLQLGWAF